MNLNKRSILVTAVGGELAFSVLKAIREMSTTPIVIGVDIDDNVVGKFWVDYFEIVPICRDKELYVKTLYKLVRDYQVDAIIPTNDHEIMLLSSLKEEFRTNFNCEILVNSFKEISLYNDKWLAYNWFVKNDVSTPRTWCYEEEVIPSRLNFPLILKPRTGGGSRHIYKVNSRDELNKYLAVVPRPIIQEIIGNDNSEYTSGTFRSSSGEVHVITMKRQLKFGMTNSAEVVTSNFLNNFCIDLIRKSELIGINNIQFRLDQGVPKVLEVNPRFSGTTGIRAHFGFNDVELWMSELYGGRAIKPTIKTGRVLRFMEEFYV